MDYQEYLKYEPFLARRCWAAVLDYLLYFAIFFAYVYFVGEKTEQGTYEAKGFAHIFAVIVLWFIYFPVIEGILGYTIFKGLFDLKVIVERRQDYRFVVSIKRHILDPIDFCFFGIVAIILAKTRNDHKRLGDMFAHSRVVLDKEENDLVIQETKSINGV
jgi:uncharacterized RDD family membrane protein YckC